MCVLSTLELHGQDAHSVSDGALVTLTFAVLLLIPLRRRRAGIAVRTH